MEYGWEKMSIITFQALCGEIFQCVRKTERYVTEQVEGIFFSSVFICIMTYNVCTRVPNTLKNLSTIEPSSLIFCLGTGKLCSVEKLIYELSRINTLLFLETVNTLL